MGNSFGGAVALRVADRGARARLGLALISAPPPDLDPSPELRQAWDAEESALEDGDLDAAAAAVAEACVPLGAPAGVREQVAVMQRRAFALQADAADLTEAPDPAEDIAALKEINVAALVAAGEHDMVDFRDGAHRIAEALPGGQTGY